VEDVLTLGGYDRVAIAESGYADTALPLITLQKVRKLHRPQPVDKVSRCPPLPTRKHPVLFEDPPVPIVDRWRVAVPREEEGDDDEGYEAPEDDGGESRECDADEDAGCYEESSGGEGAFGFFDGEDEG